MAGGRPGRVHDQDAIEAPSDVIREWGGDSDRDGARRGLPRSRRSSRRLGEPAPTIVFGPMRPVEMDVVRVARVVLEVDPQQIAFGGPQDRCRHRPVVSPSVEMRTGAHFDEALFDCDLDVPDRAT